VQFVCAPATIKDPFERAIRAEMDKMSTEHMSLFLTFMGIVAVWSTLIGGINRQFDRKNVPSFNDAQVAMFFVFAGATAVPRVYPQSVRRGMLWVWYSLMMSVITAILLLSDADPIFAVLQSYSLLTVRVCACVVYANPPFVLLWNVAVSTVAIRTFHGSDGAEGHFPNDAVETLREIEYTSCLIMFVFCVVAWNFQHGISRRTVEELAKEDRTEAMARLLSLNCDVVTELDADLRLGHDSGRFAAWLDMNTTTSWLSRKFVDFMPRSEDRSRFEDLLSAAAAGDAASIPGVVHLTLASSMRTRIEVELFYAHRRFLGESQGFLLGIVEIADRLANSRALQDLPGALPSAAASGAVLLQGLEGPPDAATIPSRHSSATCACSSVSSGFSLRSYPLRHTVLRAQQQGIVAAMLHWSIPPDPGADCCVWHSHLRAAEDAVARLTDMDCKPEFQPNQEAQCQACGLLYGGPLTPGRSGVCVSCGKRTVLCVATASHIAL